MKSAVLGADDVGLLYVRNTVGVVFNCRRHTHVWFITCKPLRSWRLHSRGSARSAGDDVTWTGRRCRFIAVECHPAAAAAQRNERMYHPAELHATSRSICIIIAMFNKPMVTYHHYQKQTAAHCSSSLQHAHTFTFNRCCNSIVETVVLLHRQQCEFYGVDW